MSETTTPQVITPAAIAAEAFAHLRPEGAALLAEGPKARRRVYRTAQIKPRTRDALMDVLAQAADEIIRLRTVAEGATFAVWEWHTNVATKPQPWWRRFASWLVRCWPP